MTPLSPAAATDAAAPEPLAEEPLPDELVHAASRAAATIAAIGTAARRPTSRRLPNSFTGESPRDHFARTWVRSRPDGRDLPPLNPQPTSSDARAQHWSAGHAI